MPLPDLLNGPRMPLSVAQPPRRRAAVGARAANALNMVMQQQQQINWCWSAVSVSVKKFFDPANPITQCQQANMQLPGQTCCIDGSTADCDRTSNVEHALDALGVLDTSLGRSMPFADVRNEIDRGHPVGCRINWSEGGAHVVCIDGYSDAGGAQLITIKDPLFGTSVIPYTAFTTHYQGTGMWVSSYTTKAQ